MAKGSPQFRHLGSLSSVTDARGFSLVNEAFPDFYVIVEVEISLLLADKNYNVQ